MNCPTCGAKNEADARFCAECGAPLENQEADAAENDQTILSTVSQVSEEAKTVSVTQEDVDNLAAEMEQAEDADFEPDTASPPSGTADPGGDTGQKSNTQRYIIIGILIILVLCCCCLVLASIGAAIFGEMDIDIDNFSYLLSTVEPLV